MSSRACLGGQQVPVTGLSESSERPHDRRVAGVKPAARRGDRSGDAVTPVDMLARGRSPRPRTSARSVMSRLVGVNPMRRGPVELHRLQVLIRAFDEVDAAGSQSGIHDAIGGRLSDRADPTADFAAPAQRSGEPVVAVIGVGREVQPRQRGSRRRGRRRRRAAVPPPVSTAVRPRGDHPDRRGAQFFVGGPRSRGSMTIVMVVCAAIIRVGPSCRTMKRGDSGSFARGSPRVRSPRPRDRRRRRGDADPQLR